MTTNKALQKTYIYSDASPELQVRGPWNKLQAPLPLSVTSGVVVGGIFPPQKLFGLTLTNTSPNLPVIPLIVHKLAI